jgi:uncharacterized protein YeaO (DUF488 family)
MEIKVKRAYEDVESNDGQRILVDRLWPRGISKKMAKIDMWVKDLAPSTELRRWYKHDPEKWLDFKSKYFKELNNKHELVAEVLGYAREGPITLIYSSKEKSLNNAVALKEYLESAGKRPIPFSSHPLKATTFPGKPMAVSTFPADMDMDPCFYLSMRVPGLTLPSPCLSWRPSRA